MSDQRTAVGLTEAEDQGTSRSTSEHDEQLPAWRRFLLRRPWIGNGLRASSGFILVIVIWASLAPTLDERVLPSPLATISAFVRTVVTGLVPVYTMDSVRTLVLAAAVAIMIGVPLGILVGFSSIAARMTAPALSFFQAVSGIAWIPLFIIWFGFTQTTVIVVVNYTALFPIIYNTMTGVRTTPPLYRNAVLILGAKRWQVIRDVVLPGALPNIVTGVRTGIAFGFRALIAGEMLISQPGLGFFIFNARQQSNTPDIIVGMILIGVLWLAMDRLFLRPFERATFERWGTAKG